MSLEAFISGKSSLTSSGGLVPNQNTNEQHHFNEATASVDESTRSSSSLDLSNKTSNLISSYRDYISNTNSDVESSMMLDGRITGQGSSSKPYSDSPPTVSFAATNTHTASSTASPDPLLRGWNNSSTNNNNNVGSPQSQITLDTIYNNDRWESGSSSSSDESCNGKLHRRTYYTHPIYHSKRFKILSVSVIAIAAIIGGVSISNKHKREAALPNWNEELKQLHENEELAVDGSAMDFEDSINDHHYKEGDREKKAEDMKEEKETEKIDERPLEEEMDEQEPATAEEPTATAADNKQLPSLQTMNEQEELVHEHYVPIQEVATAQESEEVSIPESMIPIDNQEKQQTLYTKPGGATSRPEEQEQLSAMQEVPVDHLPNDEQQATEEEVPRPEASHQAVLELPSSSQTATAVTDNFDMAAILHEKFKPLWLSSNEGWNGGSHDDAVQFCSSIRGKKLCPYSAMCPHGPGKPVMGGRHQLTFTTTGEQYAPVMGGHNHWVYIGTKDDERSATCMTHRQLEGSSPSWGLNSDRSEVKQHIMCCTVN